MKNILLILVFVGLNLYSYSSEYQDILHKAKTWDSKHNPNYDFSEIDNYAPYVEYNNINELIYNLTNRYDTDIEKVRAMYVWITYNIVYTPNFIDTEIDLEYQYDVKGYVDYITKHKKGVCRHISTILKYMCDENDIPNEIITCTIAIIDSKEPKPYHTCNIIRIGDYDYAFDATWATRKLLSGYSNIKNREYAFEYYFMSNPFLLPITHSLEGVYDIYEGENWRKYKDLSVSKVNVDNYLIKYEKIYDLFEMKFTNIDTNSYTESKIINETIDYNENYDKIVITSERGKKRRKNR